MSGAGFGVPLLAVACGLLVWQLVGLVADLLAARDDDGEVGS